MKKNNIVKGVIGFSVLALMAGGLVAANAASDTSAGTGIVNKAKHDLNQFIGKIGNKAHKTPLTDAQKADIKTKIDAVNTALNNSDYASWVIAEKALNANAPILQKINTDNFSKYAEAYKLRVQADTIMKDLGLTGNGNGIYGPGMMRGGIRK